MHVKKIILLGVILFLTVSNVSTALDQRAFFDELLAIPSGTKSISGVRLVEEKIEKALQVLGFQTEYKSHPTDPLAAPLLVATFLGQKPKYVTFVMHADTVFENATVTLREEDGKLFGPGVIDNKGGVAVAVQGIADYLQKNPNPVYSLRVLVSPTEETGSNGFLQEFARFAADSFLVLGFEPGLDDGSIIESRRGNRWYKINVQGKEAHAGRAHKEGVNACHELALKIDQLQKLNDYAKDVTVSVGHIEGGKDKYNVVCGEALAKVDTRFADLSSRNALHAKIEAVLKKNSVSSFATKQFTKTSYTIEDDCPPFSVSPLSKSHLEKYKTILTQLTGKPVLSQKSGGASDINYFSRDGVVLLDGLGAYGGNMHTENEFLLLSSLSTRAQALTQFLLNLK